MAENLDQVKKLIELATNNPNEHEATAAAVRAVKLIKEGNLFGPRPTGAAGGYASGIDDMISQMMSDRGRSDASMWRSKFTACDAERQRLARMLKAQQYQTVRDLVHLKNENTRLQQELNSWAEAHELALRAVRWSEQHPFLMLARACWRRVSNRYSFPQLLKDRDNAHSR